MKSEVMSKGWIWVSYMATVTPFWWSVDSSVSVCCARHTHVVPFSRTAKMALSGLVERPDRFSPSCSASTTDSASTPGHGVE
ncbi:hypothetical protein EYF80_018328 [Liparis tanakae]|uniref:Uncharacterized protein n=1 Tax=Liparis tanakae TaxID=230148 RepID=A0A4Z2I2F8_9TELE|nr:hypothetical protein EYF80_018328 [Liparis tanakae]